MGPLWPESSSLVAASEFPRVEIGPGESRQVCSSSGSRFRRHPVCSQHNSGQTNAVPQPTYLFLVGVLGPSCPKTVQGEGAGSQHLPAPRGARNWPKRLKLAPRPSSSTLHISLEMISRILYSSHIIHPFNNHHPRLFVSAKRWMLTCATNSLTIMAGFQQELLPNEHNHQTLPAISWFSSSKTPCQPTGDAWDWLFRPK